MNKISFSTQKSCQNNIRNSCISSYEIKKLHKKLDKERLKTLNDGQNIKMIKKHTQQTNNQFMDKIKQIENQVIIMTRKLQEQKTKNQRLEFLVNTVQSQLQKQRSKKLQKHTNKKQSNQMQDLNRTSSLIQRQIQRMIQRVNSSQFQLSQKLNKINSLRRERSLQSILYDKIEKQLYELQFYYKELLMERIMKDKQFYVVSGQFQKMRQEQEQKGQLQISSLIEKEEQSVQSNRVGGTERRQIRSRKNVYKKTLKLLQRLNSYVEKDESKMKNLQYLKKVVLILHDLHCESVDELKSINLLQNVNKNHQIYNKFQSIEGKIQKQQQQIKRLQKILRQRIKIQKNDNLIKIMNKKRELYQFNEEGERIKSQIVKFRNQFKVIFEQMEMYNQSKQTQKQMTLSNEIKDCPQNLLQNKQQLKVMMSEFNEVFIDHILLYEKSVQGQNDLMSISVRRKDRSKRRTTFVSQGKGEKQQNSARRTRQNSQKLDDILLLNVKNGQNEKNNKIIYSILSQEQLLDEGRKIMKLSKKKSQFIPK